MSNATCLVDRWEENVKIVEHFINFIIVNNTTGNSLTESIKNEFMKQDLLLPNCRGRAYDKVSKEETCLCIYFIKHIDERNI